MTVHTTYFAAIDHQKVQPSEDALVAGVVRRPHDFVDDLVDRNLQSLAPPEHLLDAVKSITDAVETDDEIDHPNQFAWEQTNFAQRYRDHLTQNRLTMVLGKLREEELERGDIWLVCYERDPQNCHRRLLADELTRGRDESPVHHPEPGTDTAEEDGTVPNARLDDYGGETA